MVSTSGGLTPFCERERGGMTLDLFRSEAKQHIRRVDVLRQRDFRVAMTGQVSSQMADAMTTLGLAQVLLFDLSPQDTMLAFLRGMVLASFPLLLVGPLAGFLADRFARKSLLRHGQLMRAALTTGAIAAATTGESSVGYVTFGLLLLATRVLYTVRSSSVPQLVLSQHLVAANSISLLLGMVAGFVGVAVAAGLEMLEVRLVFVLAIALHVASSQLYSRICVPLGGGGQPMVTVGRSVVVNRSRDWRSAFAQLQHPKVRFSISSSAAGKLLLGISYACVALIVDSRFDIEATGYAAVFGVAGAGTFLGTLTAERVIERMPRKSVSVVAAAISSLAIASMLAVDLLPIAMAAIAIASFGFQNVRVCNDAAVQTNVDPETLGRVFATYDVAYNLSFVAGATLGLTVGASVGYERVLVVSCVGYAALALAASFNGSGEPLPTRNTVNPTSSQPAVSSTLRVSNTIFPPIADATICGSTSANSAHSVSTTSASAPKHAPIDVSAQSTPSDAALVESTAGS